MTDKNENGFQRLIQSTGLDTRMLAMVAILVVIWLCLNFATDGIFLTARNLYNLAVQSSVVGIMATGMVLVILARHIDLSVGSILGFTGMMIAFFQVDMFPIGAGWNWPVTILIGLTLGAFIGAFQGYWIAYRGIPAFVVTLGGLLIYRGATFMVTDGRTVAPMNENYQLLTWDHPMIRGVMDLVLSDEIGNASMGLLKNEALPVGTFFLECIFTVEATAPAKLQLGRYLPTTPIRILVDKNGNDLAEKVSEEVLDRQLTPVKKQMASQLIKALKSQIGPLVAKAEVHGEQQIAAIQSKALANMTNKLEQEQQRLTALKAINPSVRQAEIDFLIHQQSELNHYIDKAQLTFEAVRMIVVTH